MYVKKVVLIGSMLCIFSVALSQTKEKTEAKARITGTIVDSLSRQPIEYATISLIKHGESEPSNGATSDSLGNFTVTNVSPGAFTVIVESIGYSSFTIGNVVINQKHE